MFCEGDVRSDGTLLTGETVINDLNDQNMILLPFTVDHLGAIGPLASRFLFGTKPPPQSKPPSFTFPGAQTAYETTTGPSGLTGLFPRADAAWKEATPYWFADTYHTMFPSQWAVKTLGLNIIHHLANHFTEAMEKLRLHQSTPVPTKNFISQPIRKHSRRKTLLAGPNTSYRRPDRT